MPLVRSETNLVMDCKKCFCQGQKTLVLERQLQNIPKLELQGCKLAKMVVQRKLEVVDLVASVETTFADVYKTCGEQIAVLT